MRLYAGLDARDYIAGSAPILAHSLIAKVGDIDIVAARLGWRLAQKLGLPTPAPGGDQVVQLATDIDIYDGWLGLYVDAIICRAELVDGLPIAHLSDVVAYKRLLNRSKDRVYLELIETHFAAERS